MTENNTALYPTDEGDFYDTSAYIYSEIEGVFIGELMYTQWGKHHQKIAFLDLEDGRKIVCATSDKGRNFLGLKEMAYGTKVKITLKRSLESFIGFPEAPHLPPLLGAEKLLGDCEAGGCGRKRRAPQYRTGLAAAKEKASRHRRHGK